jgi:ubiquinone/menaquinone biosynthesis C-methylase UbiE
MTVITPTHEPVRSRHSIFARAWDRIAESIEQDMTAHRAELLSGIAGRVFEIGAGNGTSFADYPPATVTEVVAVEPEPCLRARASMRARRATVPVTVQEGIGEALRYPADRFDAAVTSLTLRSVTDAEGALRELRRVLSPGAQLRFFEHVQSHDVALSRRQRFLDRTVWPRLMGGCHCSRDTLGAIERAGFVLGDVRAFDWPAFPADRTASCVIGSARVPGGRTLLRAADEQDGASP